MPARSLGQGRGEPARNAFVISPSDNTELAVVTRGIWVGGDGNIVVMLELGDIVSFPGAVAGTVVPVCARKVYATGTTATGLRGLY